MNQAIAFKLADMRMQIDAARLLVYRACWMGATGKHFEAGEGSMSKLYAGEVRVRGHRGSDPDPRRRRLREGPPRRALAPRLEDLHDLRRHVRDPAAGRRSRHLRPAHSVDRSAVPRTTLPDPYPYSSLQLLRSPAWRAPSAQIEKVRGIPDRRITDVPACCLRHRGCSVSGMGSVAPARSRARGRQRRSGCRTLRGWAGSSRLPPTRPDSCRCIGRCP